MTNSEKVYQYLKKIPKGKVLTYSRLAKLVGMKSPRVIGNILHRNPTPVVVPCHRVVNIQGKVAENFGGGGAKRQIELLETEGVKVIKNKVDLAKYLWNLH